MLCDIPKGAFVTQMSQKPDRSGEIRINRRICAKFRESKGVRIIDTGFIRYSPRPVKIAYVTKPTLATEADEREERNISREAVKPCDLQPLSLEKAEANCEIRELLGCRGEGLC
ncbi:hypothetical protein GCM10023212_34640 [Luteolibacter yonseiensis]